MNSLDWKTSLQIHLLNKIVIAIQKGRNEKYLEHCTYICKLSLNHEVVFFQIPVSAFHYLCKMLMLLSGALSKRCNTRNAHFCCLWKNLLYSLNKTSGL